MIDVCDCLWVILVNIESVFFFWIISILK